MTPMARVLIMVLASLAVGIVAGVLLRRRERLLAALDRTTMLAVYLLLFVLGLSVGANREAISHLHELGLQALLISMLSVAGSLGAVYVVWVFWFTERHASGRHFRFWILDFGLRTRSPAVPGGGSSIQNLKSKIQNHEPGAEAPRHAIWRDLRSSGIVAAFFVGGVVAGASGLIPERIIALDPTVWVLVALLLLIGVSIGSDARSRSEVRREGLRVLLVPGSVAVGTVVGSAVASVFLSSVTLPESLAVGCGFGWYSLSSVMLKAMHLEQLAVIALLSNIFREMFTPVLADLLGPLGPIAAGGATSMDSTLPMITRFSGKQYAVVSIISGVVLSTACPVLIPAILSVGK